MAREAAVAMPACGHFPKLRYVTRWLPATGPLGKEPRGYSATAEAMRGTAASRVRV